MTERFREIYRLPQVPVFQNRMYATAAEARACAKGDVVLGQSLETGMVRNISYDASLLTYDTSYQNEQSLSAAFKAHLDQTAELIASTMGGGSIVEIGCGKGFFLEMLLSRGLDVRGFDPAYEGSNLRVRRELFDAARAGRAAGFVMRHVLTYMPDAVGFLRNLAQQNGGEGLIYIEVPCFDWIIANRSWIDIYYEHINYFRLADFRRMFGRLVHSGHGFGGQYLTVIGDLATLRTPVADPADRVDMPADFLAAVDRLGLSTGGATIVWGAGAKGAIFTLACERRGVGIDMVVDINPAKQGRYLAGTGLEVIAPHHMLERAPRGSRIIVMNPHYLSEVRDMAGPGFDYLDIGNA